MGIGIRSTSMHVQINAERGTKSTKLETKEVDYGRPNRRLVKSLKIILMGCSSVVEWRIIKVV
jgi:hypothetical protein